jgi:hypothetical protein
MSFTVLDIDQRSDAWRRARCGRLCASDAKHVLATIKSGEAATRRDLRVRLVVERLTQEPQEDGYVNGDMRRGIELEAEAIAAYEARTGLLVQPCGFIMHNDLAIGCSPDGILDDFAGGAEIKVPKSATHLSYLRGGVLPAEHRAQILHSLLVTDAKYWDFCSYDPRFPEALRTFYVRTRRDDVDMAAYEQAVRLFLAETDREYEAVAGMVAA